MSVPDTTRFAPSPTGELHLGHALAALTAERAARRSGGRFLVRLEDIDGTRCRPEFAAGILQDLAWLGLRPDGPIWRQSERLSAYAAVLDRLRRRNLVYPCFCTRAEIEREIARAAEAPQGTDDPPYPGTCRRLTAAERQQLRAAGRQPAWRLDIRACLDALPDGDLEFEELGDVAGPAPGRVTVDPGTLTDVIVARRDIGVSYHLAVVTDDAAQRVTLVTRGSDLFPATPVQVLLQAVLGLPRPRYLHHRLVTDAHGRRLAKRDRDRTLRALREAGCTPDEIRGRVGWSSAVG
jgi:glutamyl-Q tRNA(Asp) synthetase